MIHYVASVYAELTVVEDDFNELILTFDSYVTYFIMIFNYYIFSLWTSSLSVLKGIQEM